MHKEHHKWYSKALQRTMELNVYGHRGRPFLVFPSSNGRYFDFEEFGMVKSVATYIKEGRMRLITVDTIDSETWHCAEYPPEKCGKRYNQYDHYVVREVVPFINKLSAGRNQSIIATGVSMGAYHAANLFFKHPDVLSGVVALSGLYRLSHFVGDYMDDNIYFNSPLNFLPNLTDDFYLSLYRDSTIIFCVGRGAWEDQMLQDTLEIKRLLSTKNIPAWIDFWGNDVAHDWTWWIRQFPYFVDTIV